jgi:hypothetical protein
LILYIDREDRRAYVFAACGFIPWLIPFVAWLAGHPNAFDATVAKYALYDAHQLDAVQGVRSLLSYASASERASRYWNFFNPAFLLFGSGIKMPFSTNLVGVFLFSFAVLLPLGIYVAVIRRAASPIHLAVVAGFAGAPLAAVVVAEQNAIFRGLGILPFGVLLATIGAHQLWFAPIRKPLRWPYPIVSLAIVLAGAGYALWTLATQSRVTSSALPLMALGIAMFAAGLVLDRLKTWRIVAICLLALIPLQCALFLADYFSAYRTRSAVWLGGNVREGLEEIIARDSREPVPYVYLSPLATTGQVDQQMTFTDAYWRFYLTKEQRLDLLARTRVFEPANADAIPTGSLILASAGDKAADALIDRGVLRRVKAIPELDGSTLFVVLQR